MIVYPTKNYNSFISVADAGTKLAELGATEWVAKTNAEKEATLINGTAILGAYCTVSTDCPFPDALVMLIQADIVNSGKYITSKVTEMKYTKAKIGSLQVEYKDNTGGGSSSLPSIVQGMLSQCINDSSIPKTRGFTLA